MNLIEQVTSALKTIFTDPEDHFQFEDERGDGHHFIVRVTSKQFIGKSRIEKSRLVYSVLNPFLESGKIHALRMDLKTPDNHE